MERGPKRILSDTANRTAAALSSDRSKVLLTAAAGTTAAGVGLYELWIEDRIANGVYALVGTQIFAGLNLKYFLDWYKSKYKQ